MYCTLCKPQDHSVTVSLVNACYDDIFFKCKKQILLQGFGITRAANSVDFYIEFKFEFSLFHEFEFNFEFNIFIFASSSSS